MSTNLYARPLPKRQEFPSWGHPLKGIIAKRYLGHDGSLTSRGKVVLDGGDLSYLQGLVDSGVGGAAKLLAMVEKCGEVEVWTAE